MRLRLLFAGFLSLWTIRARADTPMSIIHEQAAAHAGKSGAYVLDKGEEALIARAWLTDHAQQSIDVQYFIWSTDNIGILAAEALLRAAERGVRVRVIVDDLMLKVPPQSLLALAVHPGIDIRIYNPKLSVPLQKKLLNAAVDFRGVNQRMHDKVFVVDGIVAITGGRNVAAEYYDFHHEYNFRDRDALVVGEVVRAMSASFERFWNSGLSVKVEDLYDGLGVLKNSAHISDDEVKRAYRDLHAYAASPENFAPEVRAAINGAPQAFPRITREMTWGTVEFISDSPGKNSTIFSISGGGGLTTAALARLVESATRSVVIQSPYLVLSDAAKALFRKARARGVRIRINTNSLASTDNLQAFSGYRNQRDELLAMGLEIFEYRPDPEEQRRLMPRAAAGKAKPAVCGLHAKGMVVDSRVVYIGTFNLDPRSENLNTEVGVIIHDEALARRVEAAIETDMKPGNSWNARDNPDRFVPLVKRTKVRLWQLLPIKPLL